MTGNFQVFHHTNDIMDLLLASFLPSAFIQSSPIFTTCLKIIES